MTPRNRLGRGESLTAESWTGVRAAGVPNRRVAPLHPAAATRRADLTPQMRARLRKLSREQRRWGYVQLGWKTPHLHGRLDGPRQHDSHSEWTDERGPVSPSRSLAHASRAFLRRKFPLKKGIVGGPHGALHGLLRESGLKPVLRRCPAPRCSHWIQRQCDDRLCQCFRLLGGHSKPETPFSSSSRLLPIFVATMGFANAIASSTEMDKPSQSDGAITMSEEFRMSATSLRKPRKLTTTGAERPRPALPGQSAAALRPRVRGAHLRHS